MTTPPTDKGKGKQLLYNRESSPRLAPIQRPRYTSSPPTAVIRPGDLTPSPISPNVADNFAVTSSAPLRRTPSSESSKLREEIELNPEPIIRTEPPTPSSQQAVRIEPAALTKKEDEPRRLTPLDQYWTEDRRKRIVTILPFTLCFLLLIPLFPSPVLPLFYLCCRHFPLCHSFRPLWQSCLANSFPSAISSFATWSATLGSYAYPIRSHIVLALMSSSPPPCHIALLLPLSPEHSISPLLTDDPVTFYNIPWYSGSCALPSKYVLCLSFA